ncbi:MAG: hypothetical protein KME31_23905 [Tolypothrix carrinoi HA7290-LM1]|jgi:hypothetical protein|nr:hypothetical protein [Tolypothrix carrinoi HA7290-LM1]
MPSDKPRITIRVTEKELSELQTAADEEYRSVPSLVLKLVKEFLDKRRGKQNKKNDLNES